AHVAQRLRAAAGIDQCDLRCTVQRVAHRNLEFRQRFALALVRAEIPAPVVVDVGVGGSELQCLGEVLFRLAIVPQRGVHDYEGVAAWIRCSRRLVLSCTCPASWPQAASMSSPRVLRTVATKPASCNTFWKARIRTRGLVENSVWGNGLNGIRLNLHGTSRTSAASCRACFGASLTPSSITYSKVTNSRGARSM